MKHLEFILIIKKGIVKFDIKHQNIMMVHITRQKNPNILGFGFGPKPKNFSNPNPKTQSAKILINIKNSKKINLFYVIQKIKKY